jgi:hypothetical protein
VTKNGLYLLSSKDCPHFTLLNILSLMGMKYCRYIPNDAKRLAFLLPVSNINLNSFSVTEGTVDKEWLKRFVKRRTDKLSFQKS